MKARIGAVVIALFTISVFAGCSGSPQSGLPASNGNPIVSPSHAQAGVRSLRGARPFSSESVLYSFANAPDGANAWGSLINVNGTFYGTTITGGANNVGTVFSVSMSGVEHVIYSFAGGTDGANPYGGLVKVGSKLYGTTAFGGSNNNGTVYSVTTGGVEHVLYRFLGNSTDGVTPYAPLTNVNGTLYGTTDHGGSQFNGTIFSITTSGTYTSLHDFAGFPSDGAHSYAGFTNVAGVLYGATTVGGANDMGTIYTYTPGGSVHVLYSFAGGLDGAMPYACCVKIGKALYGTTAFGGKNDGTVFKITIATGAEKVLYRFLGGSDGAEPYAGLTNVNGTLYGVTQQQGASGNGTIFSIVPGGAYTKLHDFAATPDAGTSYATMLDVNGTLYGTSFAGGTAGDGAVFTFTP